MKLSKIKTEAEIRAALNAPTPGRPRVETTSVNGNLKEVRIGQCHIGIINYNDFSVMAEMPFEQAKRYKVSATAQGFPPAVSYHEDYADARTKSESFGAGVSVVFDNNQVDVLIDGAGNGGEADDQQGMGDREPTALPEARSQQAEEDRARRKGGAPGGTNGSTAEESDDLAVRRGEGGEAACLLRARRGV